MTDGAGGCVAGAQRLRRGSTLVQHLQREVQAYELGPGMCANVKASQGLMGFQLILCGPCQMVRSEDALQEPFLDEFFAMINKDSVRSSSTTPPPLAILPRHLLLRLGLLVHPPAVLPPQAH